MSWLWIVAQAPNLNANNLGIPNTRADGGVLDNVVSSTFLVVGAIAVLFLLVGAFRYILARGEESQLKQAKDTILYSIVGLVLAVSAFLIVEFISGRIAG